MSISVKCPCGQELKAERKHVGKKFTCPKCGKPNRVPSESEEDVSDDELSTFMEPEWKPLTVPIPDTQKTQHPRKPHKLSNPANIQKKFSTSVDLQDQLFAWENGGPFAEYDSILAIAVTIIGWLGIIAGSLTVFLGINQESWLVALTGGSGVLSGIAFVGFGSVIEYLAKIEQHLRKRNM